MGRPLPLSLIIIGLLILSLPLLPKTQESLTRNLAFNRLVDYLTHPSASPTDPRVRRAGELFDRLSQRDAERYQAYSLYLDHLERRLASSFNRRYYEGRLELQMARQAQASRNWDAAADHYREAIGKGTEQIGLEASLLLAEQLCAQGDGADCEQAAQAASGFSPPLSIHFAGCPGLELLGGYIDQRDMELNRPIHVVLVWRRDPSTSTPGARADIGERVDDGWRLFSWQDRVFQAGLVENLAFDGSFSWVTRPWVGTPSGHFRAYSTQALTHTALVLDTFDPTRGTVVEIYGQGHTHGGIQSRPESIEDDQPNTGYLMTGRYRSDGGAKPRIGIHWWVEDPQLGYYDIVTQPSAEWTLFAGLAAPPDGATHGRLMVLERNPSAHLWVDDLGMFAVPLPCSRQ